VGKNTSEEIGREETDRKYERQTETEIEMG
jgi:hypothetical protein